MLFSQRGNSLGMASVRPQRLGHGPQVAGVNRHDGGVASRFVERRGGRVALGDDVERNQPDSPPDRVIGSANCTSQRRPFVVTFQNRTDSPSRSRTQSRRARSV